MFAAIVAVTLSQWGPEPSPGMQQYDPGSVCQRTGGRCFLNRSGNRPRENYAYFEFAPLSGAGMGTACACTTPTGAKGEAMTFTRTGAATCSKQGLATTGIGNGDLVVCTANQPRVESSGGVLGLRVEGARTNEALRSESVDNIAWATTAAGVAAPTLTADCAVAPDGTTTADRMQIPACPTVGVDASGVNQTSGTIASPSSSAVFLKANSGTPSISICMFGLATGTRACTQFALNTSTWTRAVVNNVTNTGGMNLEIACENRTGSYSGATNTGAADILVWGAQSEAGAYATSYIPTVAAAVTRNAEAAYVTMPVTVSPSSVAATTQVPYTSPGANRRNLGVRSGTSDANRFELFYANGGPGASTYVEVASVGQQVNGVTAATMPGSNRFAAWRTAAGTQNVITNGATASAATALGALPVLDRVYVGSYISVLAELDGIIASVCVDPDPSRCR